MFFSKRGKSFNDGAEDFRKAPKNVNLSMIISDKGHRFEKVQKQKVSYFKPLIASPFYLDPRDPQECIPVEANPKSEPDQLQKRKVTMVPEIEITKSV